MKVNRKQLDGGGRNFADAELEEVACWVYSMRQKMLHVSQKMIMFNAKKIFDDKTTDLVSRDAFVAGRGWCEKFVRCHGFSLRQKNNNLGERSLIFNRSTSILCNACTSITTSI